MTPLLFQFLPKSLDYRIGGSKILIDQEKKSFKILRSIFTFNIVWNGSYRKKFCSLFFSCVINEFAD